MTLTDDLIKKRLSKARKVSRLLAFLPFVYSVVLNGSLAQGKSREESDIDILIIAKNGRIFTARFLVNLFATIFVFKRSKNDKKSHAGKFCFNYFLTDAFLTIPVGRGEEMDRYCADNYSKSMFLAGDERLFERFMLTNKQMFDRYKCKIKDQKLSSRAKSRDLLKDSSTSVGMTGCIFRIEILLGNWLEKKLKSYQIKKIEKDPRAKKHPNLIVYNNDELRFHPPRGRIKNAEL